MQTQTLVDQGDRRPLDGERHLLVRLGGEVCTKSPRTRRRFLAVLTRNARAALRREGIAAEVTSEWTRLVVATPEPARGRETLARVFGVHRVHEVVQVPFSSLPDLVDSLVPLYRERVAGRSFAIRPKRRAPLQFSSHDLAVELGAALLPVAARVDLRHPDVEVIVELHDGHADAVLESSPGTGGLPLGTGGHAVAKELALRWTPGLEPRFWVVDLAPVVLALTRRANPRLRQILLRRAMYRAGSALAEELGASALVTGESLGQVSTQTLGNIRACEQAATVPVLRPLIGMGKDEIMAQARVVGTFDVSAKVQEHCSISPGRVETWASPEQADAAERQADAESLTGEWIRGAVARRREVDLRQWTPGSLPDLVVSSVPAGAVVLDVREPEEGPLAGDRRLPFSRAAELLDTLDPAQTYVLVCASGQRSYTLARELARRGVTAWSLEGGVKALGSHAA